ncbi:MAG: glycosyltransferase [Candidatus Omnitrophota bacterium]|jgi:processive 1,2-diacylglycerol beta-glucosyltransferase
MKKIIVIYSTAGMGHKKAALAFIKVLQEKFKGECEAKLIDLLEYSTSFYRFLYISFYIFAVSRAKWLWKFIYYFSNSPRVDVVLRKIRERLDARSLKRLREMLVREAPDAVVATHFLLPGIAPALKEVDGLKARMYAIVTDYGPHSYWLSEYVDRYFVGSEYTLKECVKRGVPEEKIRVTGIPSEEEFCKRDFDENSLREKYSLDGERRTIFLLSGGFGVGPMEEMLLSLNSCRTEIQAIVVCGHNRVVYEDIEQLKQRLDYPVVLLGYTDKVAELMSVSDLMVTKAGGMSVTEAMNMRLPMILFASIPGQETWNEILLLDNGAAKKAFRVDDIPGIADEILLSEEVHDSLKRGIDKIRRPDAAEKVAGIVFEEIGG